VSKWTMLAEADRLFETGAGVCASCGFPVGTGDVRCPACRFPVGPVDVSGELRAARTRLAELTRHIEDLEREIPSLRAAASRAQDAESRAAAEVDAATAHAVTPLLAERDAIARRREEAASMLQRATDGLRLIQSLERRANGILQMMDQLEADRGELGGGTLSRRADRSAVVRRVSERYRAILAEFRYPKLADAYLAEDLTPYVRGEPYTAASSGGRVLIALAWQLAMFETAWETRSSHPGFLLLDSPQKNLGVAGDLADSLTIERVYRHLERWLAGRGVGAQIIVADNTPPATAASDVIVRYSRRADRPPYGLIDDDV